MVSCCTADVGDEGGIPDPDVPSVMFPVHDIIMHGLLHVYDILHNALSVG